jgi:hypothetical protein
VTTIAARFSPHLRAASKIAVLVRRKISPGDGASSASQPTILPDFDA